MKISIKLGLKRMEIHKSRLRIWAAEPLKRTCLIFLIGYIVWTSHGLEQLADLDWDSL
jgi:hypothetical protein